MPLIQVRQSAVHGRGVFAARPIGKGRRRLARRSQFRNYQVNIEMSHMRHSNVNKRRFKINCKSPETLTNKEKHRTSNIAGAIQALTMPSRLGACAKR